MKELQIFKAARTVNTSSVLSNEEENSLLRLQKENSEINHDMCFKKQKLYGYLFHTQQIIYFLGFAKLCFIGILEL